MQNHVYQLIKVFNHVCRSPSLLNNILLIPIDTENKKNENVEFSIGSDLPTYPHLGASCKEICADYRQLPIDVNVTC